MADRKVDTGITQRGSSYRFTVCAGYDVTGKQIKKTSTWKAPEGTTQKKADKLLFVTLPTSNYPKILQIKRRYSINYSDASYVRLFYPVPSVIISKSLINKRSRNRPDQSLVSCLTHSP